MRIHTLLIVAFALGVAGCARKEEAPEEPAAEAPAAAEIAAEEAEAEATVTLSEDTDLAAFIKHMHEHADNIDDINFALADGDLDAAMTPAYWLSRHDEVAGVPSEWKPFLEGMRVGARAIEESEDLDTARAAAKAVRDNCQGCHVAAGIVE